MTIRTTGTAAVTFTAYYVQDSFQNRYSSVGWSGPTIPVNVSLVVNVTIDGRAFTFQPGTSYSVVMLTAKNNQFTFTVITS